MALHFLSGDSSMNGKKKPKAAKKPKDKTKPKKVAKVALVPARAAFMAVIELNGLKLATKLERVWKAPGGKDKLTKMWLQFGGQPDKLKNAISKGSKEVIGSQMGVVLATAIATATPILIVAAKLITEFKAGGDAKEKKDFDSGVNQGMKDLSNDPDVTKDTTNMPDGKDVALVKKGDSPDGTTNGSLATNPGTISIIIPMLISMMHLMNPVAVVIASIITCYCMIGILVIPFSEMGIAGEKIKKISRKYFDVPASWFNRSVNFISSRISNIYHGKI